MVINHLLTGMILQVVDILLLDMSLKFESYAVQVVSCSSSP